MAAAERRQANQDMSSRMKREGECRKTSRCCICYGVISTGARKVGQVETQPDVYTHVAMTCTGPAHKANPKNPPVKPVVFKGPSRFDVRDATYWATGRDFFEREAARFVPRTFRDFKEAKDRAARAA